MSLYRNRLQRSSVWQFNMTPLIDVTFLLLTYFMLATHFASAERPDMKLPRPDDSQAVERLQENKIIINMLYNEKHPEPDLSFGSVAVGSMAELSERLTSLAERNPKIEVTLRADRRLRYGDVKKVMETVAASNLGKLQVVAELYKGT
jgi:biopolymer transport protein ExbD